jgi:tetratricopeptide (TPR) repeat protein
LIRTQIPRAGNVGNDFSLRPNQIFVKGFLMDTIFIRLAVVCLLGFLGFEAFKELKKPDQETYLDLNEAKFREDGTLAEGEHLSDAQVPAGKVKNPIKLLTYFIILAAGTGFVVVKWVLPILGDAVSTATFSSGEQAGPSPYVKAIALATAGQYPEAAAEFKLQAAANPTDRFPVMELVKLQLGKLEDVDGAIQTLHSALGQQWEERDGAFFAQRLADLYHDEKGDSASAKELLQSIIAKFPNSPAASNAIHRIREIEEADFIASRKQS